MFYDDYDRFWLLTWTTYGTWLPGDKRGFVSPVPDDSTGKRIKNNIVDTPYDADVPQLRNEAIANLKCDPVYLSTTQSEAIIDQLMETAAHRKWLLLATAIMRNHIHVVVGVPGDPNPENMLRDFKAYASRRLNKHWPKPVSGTWWTRSGSKRKLPTELAVIDAVAYVRDQANPLVVRIHDQIQERLGESHGERGA